MALALPTPRPHLLAALACLTLFTGCPKPDAPDLDDGTGAPDDTATAGTTAPGEGASEATTTGAPTSDTEPLPTTTSPNSTSGHDPSDSTTEPATGTTEPEFGSCPYAPGGVEVGLVRGEQGVVTDLSARPCGAQQQFAALAVTAADGEHLSASLCADATCDACDPADTIDLALALPDGPGGLPTHLAAGDCMQLDVAWEQAGDDPQACAPSWLALVRLHEGAPEPVPTFLYRHTATLPRADVVGPFSLTAIDHGPGAIACPCEDDCCDESPGSRRLRFIAKLWNAEIEAPPVDPGATIPLFAFGTPEGDDLYGDLALVRATIPGECAAPADHEWLLRVTPG